MPFDPAHIGFVQELYKVIEERFPRYGKKITTGMTVLVFLTAATVMINYLVSTFSPGAIRCVTYGHGLIVALIHDRPLPHFALRPQDQPYFIEDVFTTFTVVYLCFVVWNNYRIFRKFFTALQARVYDLEQIVEKSKDTRSIQRRRDS